ncbi:MAG: bifunctional diaminohydroxyphosphoribosylaminopyrimidine deaminase/5-amino-6-(5-phosphoribosylamino)uracil reductase RibD [Actinomycetota bacterium]
MTPGTASEDEKWMSIVLRLAKKGEGSASPNPLVGAVIVSGGEVVGKGWHRKPGEPHAETLALTEAGPLTKGATLFVNLEPCSHLGRTPPCVNAVVQAGITRVVSSMKDPDPRVAGRGFAALNKAGIRVEIGPGAEAAATLNQAYIVHRTSRRPFVTYKVAASLDGRAAASDGSSQWITGEAARLDAHRVRARSDAICVGVGTVVKDNPALTVRGVRKFRSPLKVVVDSAAKTPPEAELLKQGRILVAVGSGAPKKRVKALKDCGAEVMQFQTDSGKVPLPLLAKTLADRGVLSMLLEGGPKLAGHFLECGLIDKFLLYLAPKLLGGMGARAVIEDWAIPTLGDALSLRITSVRRLAEDLRVEAIMLR